MSVAPWTTAKVRRKVAELVAAIPTLELRELPPLYVDLAGAGQAARGFVVEMGTCTPINDIRDRAVGHVQDQGTVRVIMRIRPGKDALADYDDALEVADGVRAALTHPRSPDLAGLDIDFVTIASRRTIDGGRWLATELVFVCKRFEDLTRWRVEG